MINRKRIHANDRLWHFSVSASSLILIATFAIATALYIVHQQRLSQLTVRSQLIVDMLFKQDASKPTTISDISEKSRQLMELDGYVSVLIINKKGEKAFELGLPLQPSQYQQQFLKGQNWSQDHLVYYAKPINIIDSNQQQSSYYLISVFDKTYISLLNLQFLFVISIILFCITVFTVLYHSKLKNDIFSPLEDLNELISRQNKTKTITPILLKKSGIFNELLQQINEFISIQISNQMDYRAGIDNTTQELRESLETVEVQNIELDLARKNALKVNKLKSDFLQKTSQDLQTPLQGILSFVDTLERTPLSSEQYEYVSTIEESIKGLLTIVSDIHDFSRLESGKLTIDKKPLVFRKCIEDVLTMQAPIAGERGINLYSTVNNEIPPRLLGDPLRLQQVISNLVSNTIKFNNTSYVDVSTYILKAEDDVLKLRIQVDTDGSAPDMLKNWHTSDSIENITRHHLYSGADIGFSVAKGVAQHMGGSINFTYKEDFCSFTFDITLHKDETSKSEDSYIDLHHDVTALVFSNNDIGYKEITSRLVELGIRNQRVRSFSDILEVAQKLQANAHRQSRFMPLAIIEAKTSQQTLDKIVLTQTLNTLINEYSIPTIIIAPTKRHESLKKILNDIDASLIQHPILSHRFRKIILEQLGIIKLNKKQRPQQQSSQETKILLVDDNKANLKIAKALLKDMNTHITSSESGEDALLNFKKSEFDLIFMDIELPDMKGTEVTKIMRQLENETRRTPIVALTAHAVEEEKTKLLLCGMDDVTCKPLTPKIIQTIFERWLNQNKKVTFIPKNTANTSTTTALPSTTKAASPVNISSCIEIAKNDAELAQDMLEMLIESLPAERSLILQHVNDQDYNALYDVVHRLHGACCYCGVPNLKKQCLEIETLLKNRPKDYTDIDIHDLISAIDELDNWQKKHDLTALFM